MVEYYSSKNDLLTGLDKKYHNELDIQSFCLMLKDPSACYKFYWLGAIVKLVSQGKTELTFNEIIDEMIIDAWYSVLEYKLHLSPFRNGGVIDAVELAVKRLSEISGLDASADSIQIKAVLSEYDAQMHSIKTQLTQMVPFRALAGFFDKNNVSVPWGSNSKIVEITEEINRTVVLPYIFGRGTGLNREVYINEQWACMILDNLQTITGWINFEKAKWLQDNNPEVPRIVYKLEAGARERQLNNVRKLWNGIIELRPGAVRDIYNGKEILKGDYDVDHFVPWSFVMNDELWNLLPMDSSLNSSKSNLLPEWKYFKLFADNQYTMYQMVNDYDEIHILYEKCYKDNLHSPWALQDLYCTGNSHDKFINILEKNLRPVYDSAKRQGYEMWKK